MNPKILFLLLGTFGMMANPLSAQPDPAELLSQMDHILRSSSHDMTVQLKIKTKQWERLYKIRVLMKGVDHAFARILEPPKSEGQGFLRIQARLWNFLPTAERTLLIPPSMMLDQFMGSDFSNDDFVKLTYLPRDYEAKITGEETMQDFEVYHLGLTPRPAAPVVYGKLELWLRKKDAAPVRLEFYNEKSEHLRTLHYSEFRTFGSHETPTLWRMENHIEKDRETIVTILDATFDISIADSVFTRSHLEKYP